MHLPTPLSLFFWDPPRNAFTVPFLDHPVAWYGILFVLGFVLAYFIINPILARFLTQTGQISQFDIKNLQKLVAKFQEPTTPLIKQIQTQFDPSFLKKIESDPNSLKNPEIRRGIINGINRAMRSFSISRQELDKEFKNSLSTPKQTAFLLSDRLCWFIVAGTVIGARLGEVFFYDWPYFRENPLDIIKIWRGGLASHGGVLGVMLALFLFTKYVSSHIPQLNFLRLLDFVAVPSALVASFIRLGNFINQEIVGIPSDTPWAVLFAHPADSLPPLPRHPVQLYESLAYLISFFVLWTLWKYRHLDKKPGVLVGLLFIFIFGSRFILEFWKAEIDSIIGSSFMPIGQLLSIPFILLGIYLVFRAQKAKTSPP